MAEFRAQVFLSIIYDFYSLWLIRLTTEKLITDHLSHLTSHNSKLTTQN